MTALHRPLAGGDGRAELRLDRPVPAEAGDRLVLRSADGRTVGGGEVLEVPAAPGAGAPRPAARPAAPVAPTPVDPAAAAAVAAALEAGGLRPPTPHQLGEAAGLSPARLRATLGGLRAEGRAIPAGELWFSASAAADARSRARSALAERPLTLGELRDLWGVGRRQALALAEHLDASGLTVLRDGARILRRAGRDP